MIRGGGVWRVRSWSDDFCFLFGHGCLENKKRERLLISFAFCELLFHGMGKEKGNVRKTEESAFLPWGRREKSFRRTLARAVCAGGLLRPVRGSWKTGPTVTCPRQMGYSLSLCEPNGPNFRLNSHDPNSMD